jgi:hypothetical protein
MGDNSMTRKKVQKLPLPAGASIQIQIIIIGIFGSLDTTPDIRPVREGDLNFSGISIGVQIDEISQFLCTKMPG